MPRPKNHKKLIRRFNRLVDLTNFVMDNFPDNEEAIHDIGEAIKAITSRYRMFDAENGEPVSLQYSLRHITSKSLKE